MRCNCYEYCIVIILLFKCVNRYSKNVCCLRATHFRLIQCNRDSAQICVCGRTLRVFSTSPHGSLLTKSMPVRGVPVGGSSTDASIIRYSTFRGLLCNIHTCTSPDKSTHSAHTNMSNTTIFF